MNIIKYKWIFLGLSVLLVVASVAAVLTLGLKQGIDFTGGTLWQLKINKPNVMSMDIGTVLQSVNQKDFTVNVDTTDNSFLIRLKETNESDHQKFLKAFRDRFDSKDSKDGSVVTRDPSTRLRINSSTVVEELSFESIGSAIGEELRSKALWAFLLVILAISLYIAFAFRKVSHPVSSWKYGIITLLTLFHDAIIPTGLIAYFGYRGWAEMGVNFIVAILVVMGFSVHDTIVVFDRIRENLKLERGGSSDFGSLVNKSINQTFARSLNTSLTLVLVLLALYFLGAASLSYFILIILVGTIIGTYSSIFVASPLLVLWKKR